MVRDHRIETYDYAGGSLVGANFDAYSVLPINGILFGIRVKSNTFAGTKSLFLVTSGTSEVVWKMISGTQTSNTSASGLYYPVTNARYSDNTVLSGTNSLGVYSEIPLFGYYTVLSAVS